MISSSRPIAAISQRVLLAFFCVVVTFAGLPMPRCFGIVSCGKACCCATRVATARASGRTCCAAKVTSRSALAFSSDSRSSCRCNASPAPKRTFVPPSITPPEVHVPSHLAGLAVIESLPDRVTDAAPISQTHGPPRAPYLLLLALRI